MSADLFNAAEIPFNLAGELLDNSLTEEGERRVKAQAQAEVNKNQCRFDLHDDTNENAI